MQANKGQRNKHESLSAYPEVVEKLVFSVD